MATIRRTTATKKASLLSKVLPVKKAKVTQEKLTINVTTPDNYDDEEVGGHWSVEVRRGKDRFNFSASAEGVPHCCGILELGEFSINSESEKISEDDRVEGVEQLLEKLYQNATSGDTCITVLFTTVDSRACNYVTKAAAGGRLFTAVKTFTNRNSNNENTLYVSTN